MTTRQSMCCAPNQDDAAGGIPGHGDPPAAPDAGGGQGTDEAAEAEEEVHVDEASGDEAGADAPDQDAPASGVGSLGGGGAN